VRVLQYFLLLNIFLCFITLIAQFRLKEGELATIEKLDKLGFDSVIITKVDNDNFKIDIRKTGSFEEFIKE